MKNNQFVIFKLILILVVLVYPRASYASSSLDKLKKYINNIQSIAVEFTQRDINGETAKGMLIIDKPYKFRCNYYDPFPLLIVGNKNYISVYDYEMEHLSRIKARENIFYFLLVDNVDFQDKFEILSEKQSENEHIIEVRSIEYDNVSKITFDNRNMDIKQMEILENNNRIVLDFGEVYKISKVAKSLFILQDPDVFGAPGRLNREQLEKKFLLLERSD